MSIDEFNTILGPIEGNSLQWALAFWVDIGILSESPEGRYNVLEIRDEKVVESQFRRRDTQRKIFSRKSFDRSERHFKM